MIAEVSISSPLDRKKSASGGCREGQVSMHPRGERSADAGEACPSIGCWIYCCRMTIAINLMKKPEKPFRRTRCALPQSCRLSARVHLHRGDRGRLQNQLLERWRTLVDSSSSEKDAHRGNSLASFRARTLRAINLATGILTKLTTPRGAAVDLASAASFALRMAVLCATLIR